VAGETMSLYSELKRRNVFRVAAAYLVAAWLIIQVAETIVPLYGFGHSPVRALVTLLAIAFPLFLVFSWVFEFTPQGLRRETAADIEDSGPPRSGKLLDRVIMILLALALGYFAADKFLLDPARDAERVEEAVQQARSDTLVESHGDRSIAVMPFQNIGPGPGQDYFSDGISEELLNLLAKIPDLRVISRSSSFRFRDTPLDTPSIARRLNVAHLLEGTVRAAGEQLRVTARLIDARSDSQIWSDSYDYALSARNVFAIQTQIAENISAALNTVLSEENRSRIRQVPTQNLEAYEAYLLGRQRMISRTRMDLLDAAGLFNRATELDPDYALAYIGLAETQLLLSNYGYLTVEEALADAEPALVTALSLDNRIGAAHSALALSRSIRGDGAGAVKAFERAIELDPGYAQSYHWYADVLLNTFGQPQAAMPLLEKARSLDPLSPVIVVTLGEAQSRLGNVVDAVLLFRRAVELEDDFVGAYFLSSLAQLSLGDDELAEQWIRKGLARWPGEPRMLSAGIFLARYREEDERAVQEARDLMAVAPGDNTTLVTLVTYGRYQEALEAFASTHPELSCSVGPDVSTRNLFHAINLSLALQETGRRDCSSRLLREIQRILEGLPEQGHRSFGFLDVEVYARLGEKRRALDALRASVDAGLRMNWWLQLARSPHTVSLRNDPEFQSIIAEVEADMAAQRARLRELEAGGAAIRPPE
jgi:adenylate cyclase